MLLLWHTLILLYCTGYSMAQVSAKKALIYTATRHFRHESIPTAIRALQENGQRINVSFDATEDQTQFRTSNLGQYDAVVFLSTTGDVLDAEGKVALQNYFAAGGNFVGIHSASDSLNETAFFGQALGAYFDYHPPTQNATFQVLDGNHPSTRSLPTDWIVREEVYNFKSDPRSVGSKVILTVDESSYTDDRTPQNQGTPHPIAWYQEAIAGVDTGTPGRSFYTSLGHLSETWEDDTFLDHVLGGIEWVLASDSTSEDTRPDGQTGTSTSRTPTASVSDTTPSNMGEHALPSGLSEAVLLGVSMVALLLL